MFPNQEQLHIISMISDVATALGVIALVWQILLSRQQARTQFEDELTKEYRDIIKEIPVKAFFKNELRNELSDVEFQKALDDFYRYIDLTNQQILLRQDKRVSQKTWNQWRDGIRSQLKRSAFRRAWETIKSEAPDDFQELQLLERDFEVDPASWARPISDLLAAPHHFHSSSHAPKL